MGSYENSCKKILNAEFIGLKIVVLISNKLIDPPIWLIQSLQSIWDFKSFIDFNFLLQTWQIILSLDDRQSFRCWQYSFDELNKPWHLKHSNLWGWFNVVSVVSRNKNKNY